MDDRPMDKIDISGATLATLLNRSAASPADLHGFLFGHVTLSTPNPLSDDHTSAATQIITATVTSFLSLPSHLPLPPPSPSPASSLLGWFSARRKTPLRPSLRDATTTLTLSSSPALAFTPPELHSFPLPIPLSPPHDAVSRSVDPHARVQGFSVSHSGQLIRAQEPDYYQHRAFFPIPIRFFHPKCALPPFMDFELRSSDAMAEDEKEQTLASTKRNLVNQKQLDMCAEDFDIRRLNKLRGSEAANYTSELEDLYGKMLAKMDGLSRLVEQTSAKVLQQESHNMTLRYKVAGLE